MIPRSINHKMNKKIIIVIFIGVIYITTIYFRRINNIRNAKQNGKLSLKTLNKLKTLLSCKERDFELRIEMRHEFWVFKNYVRAEHGFLHCYEAVTFTTHATVEYLDHLEVLVERWQAPVSLVIHAPGHDLEDAIKSIKYLRHCLKNSHLIREYVTFHIFFSYKHFPLHFRSLEDVMKKEFICFGDPPYLIKSSNTYMRKTRLLYPVNIARNIARDAAMTHFVLSSDIDFIPSPNLNLKFLRMVARNSWPLNDLSTIPRVYPIALFQIHVNSTLPSTKLELKNLLASQSVSIFGDKRKKAFYANIPNVLQWVEVEETGILTVWPTDVFKYKKELWNPIFIGTHEDPHFNELLSWDGMNEKVSQAYIMCVQKYNYFVLNDAFLIHSGNFKPFVGEINRDVIVGRQSGFLDSYLYPQLKKIFKKPFKACDL